jgi:hypothetical protein
VSNIADRTVAFFVALNDDAVNKNWDDFTKAAFVVVPAIAAVALTKGKSGKKSLKQLIAPGIALGKLVHDVNQQVTPEHLAKAHEIVERTTASALSTVEQIKAKVRP